MALGTNRTRNWGREAQASALAILLETRNVAYQVRQNVLYLAASRNGLTLPFHESVARLEQIKRGYWVAYSMWDDRVIVSGISQRDVIRATIQTVWY